MQRHIENAVKTVFSVRNPVGEPILLVRYTILIANYFLSIPCNVIIHFIRLKVISMRRLSYSYRAPYSTTAKQLNIVTGNILHLNKLFFSFTLDFKDYLARLLF